MKYVLLFSLYVYFFIAPIAGSAINGTLGSDRFSVKKGEQAIPPILMGHNSGKNTNCGPKTPTLVHFGPLLAISLIHSFRKAGRRKVHPDPAELFLAK